MTTPLAYTSSVSWPLVSVAETASYLAWAEKVLTEQERSLVVDQLAASPTCGVLIQGTGGVRKVRFGLAGRGKSGGVRIVYYFYDETMPIYILAGFAKNEKADLTAAERATLGKLVERLLATRKVQS